MTNAMPDIAERMGDMIVERIRVYGSYSTDDLRKAEFSEDQIKRYEPLAFGIACVALGRASNVA